MSVEVIIPPADIDLLDAAKDHLRVTWSEDDDYIRRLLKAAVRWLDGPSGYLGRCVLEQTLEASFDGFRADPMIWLPYPPFISIVSIKYDGADGTEATLDPDLYGLKKERGVYMRGGQRWLGARCGIGSVRIQYVAGYADGIPDPIQQAIMMLVAHWYAVREPVSDKPMSEVPLTLDDLLSQYVVPTI